mgnify:CR=1 FL=1
MKNKIKSTKVVVTPAAFVRESTAIAETPHYDWKTQRNSVMGYGTYRQTFGPPHNMWEND